MDARVIEACMGLVSKGQDIPCRWTKPNNDGRDVWGKGRGVAVAS